MRPQTKKDEPTLPAAGEQESTGSLHGPRRSGRPDFASLMRERRWSLVAGLCLITAAVMLWRWQLDAAFVIATLGVLAWFLDVRNRLHQTHIELGERDRGRLRGEGQDENIDEGAE